MAEVRFERVTKEFGTTLAVSNLDLVVADREFLVLVGPSGCGKSTVLRLLAGLEELTSGDIYIGDRQVNDIAAKDRDIAMVFQSYALYPHMSVFGNMAFGLRLRGFPRDEISAKVEDAAAILGIRELLDRKPKQLSGGQRQRVALGRAIVRDPAAFLLDEPLSNLDAKLRVQTRAEISKLHQRLGSTFIYVTHDQTEAMTMADRIAVLDEGVLQQVGRPQELYDAPGNVFVAGFIGSPAMNMFEAVVSVDADGTSLAADGLLLEVPKTVAGRLAEMDSRKVLVGIRPEDLHDPTYQPPGIEAARFAASVDLTEPMGNEVFMHLVAGEVRLLARVDPRTSATMGEKAEIALDTSRLHVFDPQTEMSLAG